MAAFQEEPAGCVSLGGCQSMAAQTFQFDLEGGRGGGSVSPSICNYASQANFIMQEISLRPNRD